MLLFTEGCSILIRNMNSLPKLKITNLNLHSASSVQIPRNLATFQSLQPSVRLVPLNLSSASSFHVPSSSINNIFHSGPKVVLSPLKQSIIRYSQVHLHSRYFDRRRRMYPTITKCNRKRCVCCNHLSTKSTIKSLVNGRVFSVKFNSDID